MKHTLDVIAGPCSAETEQQILNTARGLKEIGVGVMRAGVWKARSRFGSFEGVGKRAMPWLNKVQQEYGMQVMTEVALPSHVEEALKSGIDKLWIGARTTVNPFMMSELAEALQGVSIPLFVKNPVSPDLALWIGSVERLLRKNSSDISLIHRGFCLPDNTPYRNTPLWDLTQRMCDEFPDLPIYCDPSHIAGNRSLLLQLCEQAVSYQYDGLFVECHYRPEIALSDASQQITPEELKKILDTLY
ncbi:MAG: phospho-2-dehydro-3-deoxyheptonate aldolase [Proteiniphilum sp.]